MFDLTLGPDLGYDFAKSILKYYKKGYSENNYYKWYRNNQQRSQGTQNLWISDTSILRRNFIHKSNF